MADGTKIEWADATLNYVNGCTVLSPGCTHCYAMKQAHRFPVRQGLTVKTKGGMVWTGEVRENPRALNQALRWRKARAIFWNAHGDLFHKKVPDEWIDRQFAVMALTPHHRHMVLTKRSGRMREYFSANRIGVVDEAAEIVADYKGGVAGEVCRENMADACPWPLPNVWLGVSVEDQARADERIPDLLATPAAVRFISAEPLLGPIDLRPFGLDVHHHPDNQHSEALAALTRAARKHLAPNGATLDWVIVGGESGPGARPMHPDWARSLRDQCEAAGVAFHFKQWGSHRLTSDCEHGEYMIPASKKEAGRLLDGVEHNGVPA